MAGLSALVLSGSLFAQSSGITQSSGINSAAESFNWLPTAQLSAQQKQQVAPFCSGGYLYSDEPESAKLQPLASQSTQISADQIEYQDDAGSLMSGNVEVRQGSRLLTADSLTIGSGQRRLELKGRISIVDAEMVLLAKEAVVDLDGTESKLEGAQYLLRTSKMRGTAQTLERGDANNIEIRQGSFSSCEPGNESWAFYADRIELNLDSGFGSAKHMRLEVAGIPVFYAPYIYFPIDDQRHTGFLMPSIGSSSDAGFELVTPYYLNLAKNYDLTLTPRVMSKRGLMLDTEFRYLGKKRTGRVDLAWLPGDRGDIDPLLGLPENPDRWLVGWHHSQRFGGGWSSQVDFNRVSDIDYFRDLEFSGFISGNPNHLSQRVQLGYDSAHWSSAIQYQKYQTIDLDLTKPYGLRPGVSVLGSDLLQNIPVELNVNAQYSDFYRDNNGLTGAQRVNGKRLVLTPELSYPLEFSSGYIRPTAKLWYLRYELTDHLNGFDPEPEFGVPAVSVDAALSLQREVDLGADGWRQILEPRIYFLNVEHERQSGLPSFDTELNRFSYAQLFRDNRFSGNDRIGDTRQLSLAFSTQLLNAAGARVFDGGLGRIFYFKDRNVVLSGLPTQTETTDHSPLAGYLRYAYSSRTDISVGFAVTGDHLIDADVRLMYRKDDRHLLRFGYRFSRADVSHDLVEQPGFSTLWGLDDRWTLVAHWDYDVAQNRTLDALAGLQYDQCCWMVSVHARKWLTDGNVLGSNVQSKSAFFVQFELKGLGNIGDKLSQIIKSKIPEFE
ncbi:MAG: LPS-assembly protein LptD [Pseudomonadales bacterium]|nr:LPS-assembly protein LptD [Pseudomonadales bacterium]